MQALSSFIQKYSYPDIIILFSQFHKPLFVSSTDQFQGLKPLSTRNFRPLFPVVTQYVRRFFPYISQAQLPQNLPMHFVTVIFLMHQPSFPSLCFNFVPSEDSTDDPHTLSFLKAKLHSLPHGHILRSPLKPLLHGHNIFFSQNLLIACKPTFSAPNIFLLSPDVFSLSCVIIFRFSCCYYDGFLCHKQPLQ